jgi:uncharacterized protein (TIGR02996 family)
MRTFEYSDPTSHKFWNIAVSGSGFTVTQGAVGASGQTQTENFLSPEIAQAEAERLIRAKLGEGYLETTPGAVSTAESFQRALVESPRDLALWLVYADYLEEQGDPRGEFMKVQIALEDEARSKPERDALRQREAELLAAHQREWLGALAPLVLDAEPFYRDLRRLNAQFTRGWFTGLACQSLSVNEARTLARTPEARLLTRLLIHGTAYENPGIEPTRGNDASYQPGPDVPQNIADYDTPSLHALLYVPHVAGVRVFRFGDGSDTPGDDGEYYGMCHANGAVIHQIVARMWRLEELYLYAHEVRAAELFGLPLPRLSVLRFDHALQYPLETLANNPTLVATRCKRWRSGKRLGNSGEGPLSRWGQGYRVTVPGVARSGHGIGEMWQCGKVAN